MRLSMTSSTVATALALALALAGTAGCGDDDGVTPMVDGGPGRDAAPPESCSTPGMSEDLPCGMCGTLTRFCTSSLVWEAGACSGEHGVCMAGSTMDRPCGVGGTVASRCNAMCTWEATGMCSAALWSCSMPLVAESREGTVSVMSDTSAGDPGPLDFGMTCGTPITDPTMRPAQVVVSYVVPGTGMRSVAITTLNDGTPANFDTLIQVRRGDCTMAPTVREGTCFDDGATPATPPPMVAEFRTVGRFAATGGETLYFVVTGFGPRGMPIADHINEGPFQLDITVADPSPPTLTMASVDVVGGSGAPSDVGRASVTGGDSGGDAVGVVLTLLDASGMPVNVNGDATIDALDDERAPFAPPGVTGMTTFMQTVDVFSLAMDVMRTSATQARVRIYDADGSESMPLTVDIHVVSEVGLGAVCDAMHICRIGLTCTSGTCAASAEVTAACAGATAIPLSGTPATGSVMGTLPAGAGVLAPPPMCLGGGGEALYRVTVPTGAFDLIASTANASTAMTLDTVLWALSTCADSTAGPAGACVDDVMGERRATLVVQNAPAGTYTIVVASYATLTAATPFGLDVTLRPVLATGAACDPAGVMNRCSAGACPAGAICP